MKLRADLFLLPFDQEPSLLLFSNQKFNDKNIRKYNYALYFIPK